MSNLYKHKILKELNIVYNNNPDLRYDEILKILGRSLSFNYLKEKLRISESKLKKNLQFLVLNEEVDELSKTAEQQHLNYKLSKIGRKSYYSNNYYNKTWFMDKSFIISLITVMISLFALSISYFSNNSSVQKITELENRILNLEKK